MTYALLAFDTDRIKDYVFATGTLRDIRGGSALLDRLNRRLVAETVLAVAPGSRTIYTQGGGALFVVDSERAEDARRAVEHLYRHETFSASITGAVIDVEGAFDDGADLHRELRLLAYRLRAAKDRSPSVTGLAAHALLRPCDACGSDYASDWWQGPEEQQQICRGCARKRDENRKVTSRVRPSVAALPSTEAAAAPLWERLIAHLHDRRYPVTPDHYRPEDFGTLGELSAPNGYFGLIYADGDGLGQQLQNLHTLAELGRFASAVDTAVYDATATVIDRHLRPTSPAGPLGFDVLFLGGDDLVMVTTAEAAIDAAITLVEDFTLTTDRMLGRPLRMSACVVLAHTAYPFSALLAAAESGLTFAKRRAAERRQSGDGLTTGLINYVVASGATYPNFADYIERVLSDRGPGGVEHIERTLRPYTPSELRQLTAMIRTLSNAPRTKLQQLREACFLSYRMAILEAHTTLARWPDGQGRQAILALLTSLAAERGASAQAFPWLQHGHTYRTPFIDLVDLYRFIPAEGHPHADT